MPANWMKAAAVVLLWCGLSGLCTGVLANTTAGSPGGSATGQPARLRLALLLPLRSPSLKAAAEMVRDGFSAAHELSRGDVDLTVIETDDVARNIIATYRESAAGFDIVVGPMTRSAVSALATSGAVNRPTIALAQPESAGDTDIRVPPGMLVMGLSIEDEARQAAGMAAREHGGAKALIVSTNVAWQKRAARAFIGQWQKSGAPVDIMQLSVARNRLDDAALTQLKKRFLTDPPAFIFVALDADQTIQLRTAIDPRVDVFGTSQLNPGIPGDTAGVAPRPLLDGVQLLDIPWQIQPEHRGVAMHPHPLTIGEAPRNADLERLYALGIDAFRIAAEIGTGQTAFNVDGVTGRLAVQFDGSSPSRFERIVQPAIYRGGIVQPVADGR